MKEADVVLTPIPQADGVIKNRPAIILREMPPYRDFLVCGVSTQLDREVKGYDEVISDTDKDFQSSGLRTSSLVRLGFPSRSSQPSDHRRYWFYLFNTSRKTAKDAERLLEHESSLIRSVSLTHYSFTHHCFQSSAG